MIGFPEYMSFFSEFFINIVSSLSYYSNQISWRTILEIDLCNALVIFQTNKEYLEPVYDQSDIKAFEITKQRSKQKSSMNTSEINHHY